MATKKLLTFKEAAKKASYAILEPKDGKDGVSATLCFCEYASDWTVDDDGDPMGAWLFTAVNDNDILDDAITDVEVTGLKRYGKTNRWVWGNTIISLVKAETI
jgi:hypothetical protein